MLPRADVDLDALDAFVPVVLGCVSLLRRVDSIARAVSAATPATPAGQDAPTGDADPVVHALLGAIALRGRIRARLDEEVPARACKEGTEVSPHQGKRGPRPRALLR